MQQYRVNYALLIGLMVGTVVCSGAAYGLWRFQIGRNAGVLRADAEKALEEGNYRDAVRNYASYLSIRGSDDDARIKFANAYADLAEQDDVAPEEFFTALAVLENTVNQLPDATTLQKRLAEFYFTLRRYKDALDHVGYLLGKDPNNVELKVLQAQYLESAGSYDEAIEKSMQLVGYDSDAGTFDAEKALAPHEVDVYARLANGLRVHREQPALADQVMEQLIQVNPDSAAAHLRRGEYLIAAKNAEAGEAEIQKAYELAPEDADVLLKMAQLQLQQKQLDKAREYLQTGKKLHLEDIRFYEMLAILESTDSEYEKALAEVDEGLEAVAGQKARMLLLLKSRLQSQAGDIEGMRQTVDDMRKAKFLPEYVEFTDVQILLAEHKWFEAAEALSRLRPRVEDVAQLAPQIDYQLGFCYEQLGQFDLALQRYTLVLQNNPLNDQALAGKQRVLARKGGEDATSGAAPAEEPWRKALAEELQKPGAERDWARINQAVDEAAKQKNVTGVELILLKARLKIAQEDLSGARQLLKEANKMDPEDVRVYELLVQAAQIDPQLGPEKAMAMLDKVVQKFGDRPELRLDRAELYTAIHGDRLPEQLSELAEPKADWTGDQKSTLWTGLAVRFTSLGMNDQARLCWSRVADMHPNNLPLRVTLFNLALEANDDAGVTVAQQKILDIVQDKHDSTWLYTEARRLLSLVRRRQLPTETTGEIRELVARALEQRPDWAELNLLQAELDLLDGKTEKALAEYDRAEKLGRLPTMATVRHIQLLVQRERFQEAKALVERLSLNNRRQLLGPTYSEILLRTNDAEAAVAEARAVAEANADDAQNQLWYGQLLGRASQLPSVGDTQKAEYLKAGTAAIERAVQLEPQLVDGWYVLLSYHLFQKDPERALQVLRDAQLIVSGDLLPQFLAKSYEALGYWFDAENMYRLMYETQPDETSRAKQLAAFYLGRVYQLKNGPAKATPLINQILRAGAEGKIAADDPDLQWARRQGAELLAAQNDYQQLLKAEKLLASNFQNGFLSVQDQLQMAHILASRPEPESRLKATQLFEAVAANQSLDLASEMTLGRMYFTIGDWAKCQAQMRKTIGRFSTMSWPRDVYVRMLLDHGDRRDYSEAALQLNKLRELAPGHPRVIELSVRLNSKLGKEKEARAELLRLMPQVASASDIKDEQVQALETAAELLVDVGDLDDAEKVYRLLAPRDREHAVGLATFLGKHRDTDQCFQELETLYSAGQISSVIQAAIEVVNERRDVVGDKYDQQIQTWIDRGLRENPDSIALLMLQSGFYEVEQKYDDAAALYRKLLARNDLTGVRRAVILNNLSYLVALAGSDRSSASEAMTLVQEAAQILGPTTDILDTRAVAYIAVGDYRKAIADAELSVLDTPTAPKYFHKAVAHMLAGEKREALQSWEKAEELGLKRESLNRIEFGRYDDMKAKIEELRTQSTL